MHTPKTLKLLAASAFAVAAVGTPLAQAAAKDYPPGPSAPAATAWTPGPSVSSSIIAI